MIAVFEDLKRGKYCRTTSKVLQAQPKCERKPSSNGDIGDNDEFFQASTVHQQGEVVDVTTMPGGDVYDSEYHICLEEVPIITPCGDVVVSTLSFKVYLIIHQYFYINIAVTF